MLVLDTLTTHVGSALYETFPPAETRRRLSRLELHSTPPHGRWLNMAETELSIRARQCLDRRIPDHDPRARAVAAWETTRNTRHCTITWRFTTDAARSKLTRLYPSL